VLVAPQQLVARVLEASGAGQVMTVYRTVEEAVAGG
jgi:anti-anti-sigma regulatory factor